jgi:hypothetical protein
MDAAKRKELIALYKDGYRAVAEVMAGAPEDELDTAPAPGKWTAREIVHHLGDSEMTSAVRLRLLIAMPSPQIVGYDQEVFAQRLYYKERPVEASLDALNAARRTSTEILERLGEADWRREGIHTEMGRYTVERWLEIYSVHAHAHADQIRVAREAARKAKLEQTEQTRKGR